MKLDLLTGVASIQPRWTVRIVEGPPPHWARVLAARVADALLIVFLIVLMGLGAAIDPEAFAQGLQQGLIMALASR